jgi:carboxymethylenebutenolidase
MCYNDADRPPMPPAATGPATGSDLTLTSADGAQFAAYVAQPATPGAAQVLICPDVRGLHGFYRDLALRFASVGIPALAIDYFGRTAGLGPRDDSFEYMPHVQQVQEQTLFPDIRAALDALRGGAGAERSTFVLGFCFGGSVSLLTATQDLGLAGAVAFYSGLSRNLGGGTVLEQAARVKIPVLGLFGGADKGIPPDQLAALEAQLARAGVPHTIVSYPGAPHSFFDRRAADYAAESADAWQRVLAFMGAASEPVPA